MSILPGTGAWRGFWIMLALSGATCAFWVYYRVAVNVQSLPYPHFLVDYSHGLMRRALVGEIVSFFLPTVPILAVFLFGIAATLATLVLYLLLFRRLFGFRRASLPLLALVLGSPFFFKNFFYNLGYFDVLGCIVALVALLLPVNALYPLLLTLACIALVFVHHLHVLLYVPTIWFILVVRFCMQRERLSGRRLAWAGALLSVVGAAFLLLLAFGTPAISESTLLAHMKARAADPFYAPYAGIWFRTPLQEWRDTMQKLPQNLLQAPLYAVMFVLHWPLLRLACQSIAGLGARPDRRVVFCGIGAILTAYLVIFAMVFDYSRWISSLLVCLWLTVHALRQLPSVPGIPLPLPTASNRRFAWLVTLIPCVGTVTPI